MDSTVVYVADKNLDAIIALVSVEDVVTRDRVPQKPERLLSSHPIKRDTCGGDPLPPVLTDAERIEGLEARVADLERRLGGDWKLVPGDLPGNYSPDASPEHDRINFLLAQERVRRGA